jgi:uncharacterized protein
MTIQGNYIGMALEVSDLDVENVDYFRHCAAHDYHLQRCDDCALVRYPPTTACPWCASPKSSWVAVEAKGTVHSYVEVHHAIQPAFKSKLPYMILLVDLDTQKGKPSEHEALRVVGNLCDKKGELAAADLVKKVGIGTRVSMVFADVAPGLSIPHWTIDEAAKQPANPWRYPE